MELHSMNTSEVNFNYMISLIHVKGVGNNRFERIEFLKQRYHEFRETVKAKLMNNDKGQPILNDESDISHPVASNTLFIKSNKSIEDLKFALKDLDIVKAISDHGSLQSEIRAVQHDVIR